VDLCSTAATSINSYIKNLGRWTVAKSRICDRPAAQNSSERM